MEFIIFLKRYLNWRIVRGVAELQILTRASYIMLVFVPILAGTWPAVRLYVNSHNEAVVKATEILENNSKYFDSARKKLTKTMTQVDSLPPKALVIIDNLEKNSNEFSSDVNKFTNDFMPRTLDEPLLPWTWAAAFFASLFAVLAHLIYQLSAPEILRRYDLDGFVKLRKEDYSNHPSEEAINRAQEYLGTRAGINESKLDEERAYKLYKKIQSEYEDMKNFGGSQRFSNTLSQLSITELSNLQSFIQTKMRLSDAEKILELVQEAYLSNSVKIGNTDAQKQKIMTTVERGARAEYLFWAGKNMPMAFITTSMYAISVFVLFEVILTQALRVMEVSGWTSIFELIKL